MGFGGIVFGGVGIGELSALLMATGSSGSGSAALEGLGGLSCGSEVDCAVGVLGARPTSLATESLSARGTLGGEGRVWEDTKGSGLAMLPGPSGEYSCLGMEGRGLGRTGGFLLGGSGGLSSLDRLQQLRKRYLHERVHRRTRNRKPHRVIARRRRRLPLVGPLRKSPFVRPASSPRPGHSDVVHSSHFGGNDRRVAPGAYRGRAVSSDPKSVPLLVLPSE